MTIIMKLSLCLWTALVLVPTTTASSSPAFVVDSAVRLAGSSLPGSSTPELPSQILLATAALKGVTCCVAPGVAAKALGWGDTNRMEENLLQGCGTVLLNLAVTSYLALKTDCSVYKAIAYGHIPTLLFACQRLWSDEAEALGADDSIGTVFTVAMTGLGASILSDRWRPALASQLLPGLTLLPAIFMYVAPSRALGVLIKYGGLDKKRESSSW